MVNISNTLISGIKGAIAANTPELPGAVAAYLTFQDMPYALPFAAMQVYHLAGEKSIIGFFTPIGKQVLNRLLGSFGGNGGGRRRRRRSRKRNKRGSK